MEPVEGEGSKNITASCEKQFLRQPWQLVQSVTLYAPRGKVRNAISVLHVHPEQERIKCLITSLEGVVLFEAIYDQGPEILRAVPQFQDEEFARTLFRDIRVVLFAPEAGTIKTGKTSDGVWACEYELNNEGLVRVLLQEGDQREILQYSSSGKHLQTIEASYGKPAFNPQSVREQSAIPEKLVIQNHRALGYKLELELIEAKALN